jgi:predicted aminopeptidase
MKFYDTSSLLLLEDNLFSEYFIISSITLNELEEIKTSPRKDEDVKAAARHLLHALENNPKSYHTVIYNSHIGERVEQASIDLNNDAKILACAVYYQRTFKPEKF